MPINALPLFRQRHLVVNATQPHASHATSMVLDIAEGSVTNENASSIVTSRMAMT